MRSQYTVVVEIALSSHDKIDPVRLELPFDDWPSADMVVEHYIALAKLKGSRVRSAHLVENMGRVAHRSSEHIQEEPRPGPVLTVVGR